MPRAVPKHGLWEGGGFRCSSGGEKPLRADSVQPRNAVVREQPPRQGSSPTNTRFVPATEFPSLDSVGVGGGGVSVLPNRFNLSSAQQRSLWAPGRMKRTWRQREAPNGVALHQLTSLLQGLWLGHPGTGQVRGQGCCHWSWGRPGACSGGRGENDGQELGAEEEKGAGL